MKNGAMISYVVARIALAYYACIRVAEMIE